MKGNLLGILVSLLIHGGLVGLITHLTHEKQPTAPVETTTPLRLAMFKEAKPTPPPASILPVTLQQQRPLPSPSTPVRTVVKKTNKPLLSQPKVKKKQPTRKLATRKAVKKVQKKQPKPKPKKEVKVVKKKQAAAQKKRPTNDPTLDAMIDALQARSQTRKTQAVIVKTPDSSAPALHPHPSIPKPTAKPVHQTTRLKPVKPEIKPDNQHAEQQYKTRLQRLIAQQKTYPRRARRQHKEGTVIVSFTLYANGTIHQLAIKQSSGSTLLDKAALKTIRRISGRLPFPPSLQRRQWSFRLPLVYRLR